MGGSFFIGLSGLNANSSGIKNVGHNLANSNTVGYKTNNLFFEELRAAASSEGQGVRSSSTQQVWSQGNIQTSQVATDVAIQGNGFFVVNNDTGSSFFSRAGNFQISNEGRLVTPDGLSVMGYPASAGQVDTTAALTPINLAPGTMQSATPTSLVRFSTNLNAETTAGDTFSTSSVVYDSLGSSHVVTVDFTRTAGGWDYEMTVPAEDTGGAATDPPVVINSGSLTFDPSGQLTGPAADVANITITGLSNGANDIDFTWDLYSDSGQSYLTQFTLPNSTAETFQDGRAAGTLNGFTIQQSGLIEGLFSNGLTQPLGQLALASFTNPQGLVRVGDNLYVGTSESGEASVGEPDTGGRGRIQGNALEMANVDIAEEFIKLIIFQRGYQANSRIITTSDQITLEALQLKQ